MRFRSGEINDVSGYRFVFAPLRTVVVLVYLVDIRCYIDDCKISLILYM